MATKPNEQQQGDPNQSPVPVRQQPDQQPIQQPINPQPEPNPSQS